MAWIFLGALPCRKRNLTTASISILLKSRASLTFFRGCFLPERPNDLSAPRYIMQPCTSMPTFLRNVLHQCADSMWVLSKSKPPSSASRFRPLFFKPVLNVESSRNVMAHSDAREGKWRENWRMECVASTLHTTWGLGVSSFILQLKCDGTRWRTGGEVKGKLANGVGSQYPSHYLGTGCI